MSGREEHKGTVIKVAPALDEDAMAMNATADVAASFKKFLNGMSVASRSVPFRWGSNGHRQCQRDRRRKSLSMSVGDIIVTADDADGDPQSTVTFMGDFSFATMVFTAWRRRLWCGD